MRNGLTSTLLPAALILILVLTTPSASPADVPMVAPAKVGLSPQRLQRVDNYLQELIDARQRAGFVYGVAVLRNPAHNQINGSAGEFYWEGGSNVYFWCDPQEEMVGLLMYQYRPGGSDRVFRRFKALVYQALVV